MCNYHIHPEWTWNFLEGYDVVLFVLSENSNSQPINLSCRDEYPIGTPMILANFNLDIARENVDDLQIEVFDIAEDSVCQINGADQTLRDSVICAQSEDGDVCNGKTDA